MPKLISGPMLLFPASKFTNNEEILLILYHWKQSTDHQELLTG